MQVGQIDVYFFPYCLHEGLPAPENSSQMQQILSLTVDSPNIKPLPLQKLTNLFLILQIRKNKQISLKRIAIINKQPLPKADPFDKFLQSYQIPLTLLKSSLLTK